MDQANYIHLLSYTNRVSLLGSHRGGGGGRAVPPSQYFRKGPDPPNNYPATYLSQAYAIQ